MSLPHGSCEHFHEVHGGVGFYVAFVITFKGMVVIAVGTVALILEFAWLVGVHTGLLELAESVRIEPTRLLHWLMFLRHAHYHSVNSDKIVLLNQN